AAPPGGPWAPGATARLSVPTPIEHPQGSAHPEPVPTRYPLFQRGIRMRRSRIAWSGLLLLALTLHLVLVAGCGSVPETGTQASPVDPQEAKKQQQAYADFAK